MYCMHEHNLSNFTVLGKILFRSYESIELLIQMYWSYIGNDEAHRVLHNCPSEFKAYQTPERIRLLVIKWALLRPFLNQISDHTRQDLTEKVSHNCSTLVLTPSMTRSLPILKVSMKVSAWYCKITKDQSFGMANEELHKRLNLSEISTTIWRQPPDRDASLHQKEQFRKPLKP